MSTEVMHAMKEMLRILIHGSEDEREAMCREIEADLARRKTEKGR